jgi:transcriptional regulator with XRE-family HTH domain
VAHTIEQAIGQEIRRRREAAGIGQSALAAAARQYGLPWTRALVAAVELGRKRLTLGELALMPIVLAEAVTGGLVLSLRDLIPDDDRLVAVGPGLELPLRVARPLLLGDDDTSSTARALLLGGDDSEWTSELKEVGAESRAVEAAGDAEQKAALALRISPEFLVDAAHQRWGRGLTAERDRRVEAYTRPMLKLDPSEAERPEWPRRLQAIKGHITRELLKELQTAKAMTRKATTKRKAKR